MDRTKGTFVIPNSIAILLVLGTLAAILFFGLTPKNYVAVNDAEWLDDRPGLQFDGSGIAYVESVPSMSADRFSIQIGFTPATPPAPGFSLILMLHDGNDDGQLIIGQWQSTVIIMNGDDYDHRRGLPRVNFDTSKMETAGIFLTLASGPDGTRMYVNGQLLATRDDMTLEYPGTGKTAGTMVLGNSVYARHPWDGALYGISIYDRDITATQEKEHYGQWVTTHDFAFARNAGATVLLSFTDADTDVLVVPDRLQGVRRQILRIGEGRISDIGRFVEDILLNLFGFMPFGFALCALALAITGRRVGVSLLLTIGCGFALSLAIEIVQAWIPSRYSSLLDLGLNGVGTAVGAWVALLFVAGRRQGVE